MGNKNNEEFDQDVDEMVRNLKAQRARYYKQQGALSTSSDNVVDMMLTHGELLAITAKQSHKDLESLHASVETMKENITKLDESLSHIDGRVSELNKGIDQMDTNIQNINNTMNRVGQETEKLTKSSDRVQWLTTGLIILAIVQAVLIARPYL